jgi:nucleotide-binding universal stress UspA family protein
MFDNVIVGVDGRQGGRDAIALAKHLTTPGAHVTCVHVYGGNVLSRSGAALVPAGGREKSEQLLAKERADASIDTEIVACAAPSVGRGLHEFAERRESDLLVVGSCHRGMLGRVLLGDDTSAAINGAPCAVAIAPAGYTAETASLSRIGVGYDGSSESEQALDSARELAARNGSTITALAVISLQSIPYGEPIPDNWPEVAKQLVSEERRRLHGFADIDGDATYGEPSDELAAFSEDVDLLIVGSRSYGPIGRLFNGSTSNYLAKHARCPLLVLPRSAASPRAETAERAQPTAAHS